jgi:hypothetical protein
MDADTSRMPAERAMWYREEEDLERDLRFIHDEFKTGLELVAKIDRPSVAIFGSARIGEAHPQYASVRALGAAFASEGWAVVTGGGPGLMEAANRGAKEAGGLSIGLGIKLAHEQRLNDWLDLSYDFKHFYARKVCFVKASEGFIACPGGWGTNDELYEALVLIQVGKIHHFPVVLFGDGHWRWFVEWSHRMVEEGTIVPGDLDIVTITDDPAVAVETILASYRRSRGYVA